MSYNKRNLLLKIIEIQGIVMEGKNRGVSQKWTFEHKIKKPYFINYSTFNSYMGRNAKRELEVLDRKEKEKNTKQLKLFE